MSHNSIKQLLDLANQGKLDEIDTLAALAQGWTQFKQTWLGSDYSVTDYHPTRNKAQAWDLMVKGELSLYINNFKINGIKINTAEIGGGIDIDYKDPLIAVTIAFILAKQGEE